MTATPSSDPARDARHEPAAVRPGFHGLTVPVHRASTVVFENTAAFLARRSQLFDGYSYGLYGTPTTRALEEQVAAIEGGERSVVVPSGLAALTHPLLALLQGGDHLLVADCVYGPLRDFCTGPLARLGIAVDFIAADAGSVAAAWTPRTRMVVLESPGSFTMELQDLAAISREAHAQGGLVMTDNTWGFGQSRLFEQGIDIVATALSKYAAGHSDVCMGSITVNDGPLFRELKRFVAGVGSGVSSDDAYLVLRGLSTLTLRLQEHARRALEVVHWLRLRPEVAQLMHPADPQDAGHERFRRFFSGGNGLVSLRLHTQSLPAISAMLDGLVHFRLGASWGGPQSLVSLSDLSAVRSVDPPAAGSYLLRLHVGLEPMPALLADLEAGFDRLNAALADTSPAALPTLPLATERLRP